MPEGKPNKVLFDDLNGLLIKIVLCLFCFLQLGRFWANLNCSSYLMFQARHPGPSYKDRTRCAERVYFHRPAIDCFRPCLIPWTYVALGLHRKLRSIMLYSCSSII